MLPISFIVGVAESSYGKRDANFRGRFPKGNWQRRGQDPGLTELWVGKTGQAPSLHEDFSGYSPATW